MPQDQSYLPESELTWAIETAQRLIRTRKWPAGVDVDELESAAIDRAYLAWKRYDPRKGKWRYYFHRHFSWGIQEAMRDYGRCRASSQRSKHGPPISLSLALDESGSVTLLDRIADPSSAFEEAAELRMMIREVLEVLTETERAVIVGHYLNGKTYREIAKELNRSPSYVAGEKHKAMAKLRIACADMEWPE